MDTDKVKNDFVSVLFLFKFIAQQPTQIALCYLMYLIYIIIYRYIVNIKYMSILYKALYISDYKVCMKSLQN